MEEDLSKKFIEELNKSVKSLEFEANSGRNNMYTAKEKNGDELIPRGGVILGKDGQIGSKYYKYEDIINAIETFSSNLSEQPELMEEESHKITKTKKSEIDMEAFIETIKTALKVYVEKNERIVNQDARKISMDVPNDVGNKTKKVKGGMFAGKKGSDLENGEYISEEDIKIAINEVISDVPKDIPQKPDNKEGDDIKPHKEDDDKHVITENKGKSKNKWWKKVAIILTTIAISLSISNAAHAPGVENDSKVYVKEIETVMTDRNIVLDVNSNYEDGIGSDFEVQGELRYGQDTRKELTESLKDNRYVKHGDTCQIDGISINDINTGDIVTSAYGEESEGNIDIHDFIEENAPTSGGTYKVYVHVKQVEDNGKSTRLGWVKAGTARDTGIIEKDKGIEYIIVEEKDGNIEDIVQTEYLPAGVEYLDIEKASEDIKETVDDYTDNIISNEEIDDREER